MKKDASSTATLVTRGLWLAACEPRMTSWADGETAFLAGETLGRLGGRDDLWVRAARLSGFRRAVFAAERRVLPGLCLHYVLRKRFIEASVLRRVADGARRVIVLGAGLDSLSLRMARRLPSVSVVEVDHPASQALKLRATTGLAGRDGVEFVAADLHSDLGWLANADAKGPTVIVAEGLLMYLSPSTVEALFYAIASLPVRVTVVFTAMGLDGDGNPAFESQGGAVGRWLKKKREPFLWGIDPDHVSMWLDRVGFRLDECADADRLRREFGVTATEPLARGEGIFVASSKNGDF